MTNPINVIFGKVAHWPLLAEVSGFNKIKNLIQNVDSLHFEPSISDHEKDLDLDSEPKDFIDTWLQEMRKVAKRQSRSPFHPDIGRGSLKCVMFDLLLGGMDTTSQTIVWTILYLLHHPSVKTKVHQEIDRVSFEDIVLNADMISQIFVGDW